MSLCPWLNIRESLQLKFSLWYVWRLFRGKMFNGELSCSGILRNWHISSLMLFDLNHVSVLINNFFFGNISVVTLHDTFDRSLRSIRLSKRTRLCNLLYMLISLYCLSILHPQIKSIIMFDFLYFQTVIERFIYILTLMFSFYVA